MQLYTLLVLVEQITSWQLECCRETPFVLQESVLDSDLKSNLFQLYFLQNNKFLTEVLVGILKWPEETTKTLQCNWNNIEKNRRQCNLLGTSCFSNSSQWSGSCLSQCAY